MSAARAGLGSALLLAAGACRGGAPMPRMEAPLRLSTEPVPAERRIAHPSGALRYVRQVMVHPDGHTLPHGREREYAESGAQVAERSFRDGEPIDTWFYWYPSGARRAELHFRGPQVPAPMTWWHENGSISAQGLARDGMREGTWTWYHENGRKSEQGELCAGRRDGLWRTWYADGRRRSEARYAEGIRIGPWTEWDEDGVAHARGPGARAELELAPATSTEPLSEPLSENGP